jgi:hypothetical protein
MATRSAIGIKHGDRIKAIYAHWDGYIEHNGVILEEFYSDSVAVNKLIANGDVSSLGASVGKKVDFGHRWEDSDYIKVGGTHVAPQCVFYSRDRGEDAPFKSFASESEFANHYNACGSEYFYLYDHGVWYVRMGTRFAFKPLHEELNRVLNQEPA